MVRSEESITEKLSNKAAEVFGKAEARFINRELSWLNFNFRVLEEAANPRNPLLERVRFLSISASNLDEFYMVRVAGLMDQVRQGMMKPSNDGLTPAQQLQQVHLRARELMREQQRIWLQVMQELREQQVFVVPLVELEAEERRYLRLYFMDNIFPVLTPIAIDPAHPFPFLPNQGLAMVLQLVMPDSLSGHGVGGHGLGQSRSEQVAVIPLPAKLPRFIRLPGEEARLVLLEDVITLSLDALFPGAALLETGLFRILRDSDIEIEEEAEDLMGNFELAVKKRRRGQVIRLKINASISASLLQFVMEHLPASSEEVVLIEGMMGLSHLGELCNIPRPDLLYPTYKPRFPERINDFGGNCFAAIESKDIVVHHPFESFDVVVQFLSQAAEDPDVLSIKQTLYRTSNNSPIVQALIKAAELGKSVTAVVELKARFDEEANIRWARDLEKAGVHVIFGFVNLKTHAKVSLVTRRVDGKLRSYVHFGTGNYHPQTAKVYTDLSFFTCDPRLTRDAAYLFNYLTGYAPPRQFQKLRVAPVGLRDGLFELIEAEIEHARAGRPANIWAKMNALVDGRIIDMLYYASQQGVKIDLVVRGVCALKPGVPGFSENIHVKSIVGRFLEHSRIFCFGDGHILPSPQARLFIASADWMSRNFDRRIEVMVPIENPTVHEQILGQIMVANLKDTLQSWELDGEGVYHRMEAGEYPFSMHDYCMKNPSLSGRGKALKRDRKSAARPRSHAIKPA